MRTKWDIQKEQVRDLVQQADMLMARAAHIEENQAWALTAPCGRACAGCGTVLVTEADFAKHFLVKDERYLNLGECPDRVKESV